MSFGNKCNREKNEQGREMEVLEGVFGIPEERPQGPCDV